MNECLIEIKKLDMYYGKNNVLKNIDLAFSKGEISVLMGPNGSGKSTLLKSILGLVIPKSGDILVNEINTKNDFHYRKYIGYMPQIANYPSNLKVIELFNIVKDIRADIKILDEELIENFKLYEIYEKNFGQLSGGYRQRVTAAIAFLFNPEIVILDEPTASLDPLSTEVIKSKILKSKEEGKTILISSHIIPEADELADRIVYLLDGTILIDKKIKEMKNGSGETLGKVLSKALQKKIITNEQ
jgi:Cu-processing system ATP-binding protein